MSEPLHILIVGGQREFIGIVLIFSNKHLRGTCRDRIPHLLQQFQWWVFLKNLNDAIALTLAEDLSAGQDT